MFLKSEYRKCVLHKNEQIYLDQLMLQNEETNEELLYIVEVEGSDDFGKELIEAVRDVFQNLYFENSEKASEEKFEDCLKEINQRIVFFKEKEELDDVKIHSVLGIINDEILLLTQSGNAEAYLVRNGKLNIISDGSSPFHEKELYSSVASGELVDNDILLLSTTRLLRFLSSSQLVSVYKGGHDEAIDTIKDFATANEQEDLSLLSVVFKKNKSVQGISEEGRIKRRQSSVVSSFFNEIYSYISDLFDFKKDRISKKGLLYGIIVIVFLLMGTIWILSSQFENDANIEKYRQMMIEIDSDLDRVSTVVLQDRVQANKILDESETKLTEIINADYFRNEAGDKSDIIRTKREEINYIFRIKNLTPVADLSEKRSDVDALGIISFDDEEKSYIYDYNGLYNIILSLVESPLTISDTESVIKGVRMDDKDVIIFYTQSGKIIEYKNGNFSLADTKDEIWRNAVDLGVFKKNLYLLDPALSQIWKYTRLNDGYSTSKEYVKDSNLDLTDALSMAIDGSVYILKKNQEIYQLYAGNKKEFQIKDLPENVLQGTSKIFTLIDQKYLYLLDSENNRVIVIEKGGDSGVGRYIKQYIFDDIDPIKDLYVDPIEKTLYVINRQFLYKIDISESEGLPSE